MRYQSGSLGRRIGNLYATLARLPLRRTFRHGILAPAARDPQLRAALLAEGLNALLAGDLSEMRSGLRRYVNAAIGFARLSQATGIHEKSLMRMLGPKGNPRAEHLTRLIAALADREGWALTVRIGEPE